MAKIEIDKEFLDRVLAEQNEMKRKIKDLTAKIERIGKQEGLFPLIVKGSIVHDRISREDQKEFFRQITLLMIKFRVRKVDTKLDFNFL